MSTTRIRLLGRPAFSVDGVEVSAFRSSRIPALVGLLATKRGTWSRDEAANLLWPERETAVARHNLRQTVLYVRQLLGDGAITGDRSSVSLNPELEVDADILFAARDALQSPHESLKTAERVIETDGKEFLAGIDDEWAHSIRIKIARRQLSAILQVSQANLDRDPTRSLELATRAAEIEPYLDRARVRKILALRKLGNEASAHAEYQEYKTLLISDLRIEPSRLVQAALEDSLAGQDRGTAPALTFSDQIDSLVSADRLPQALELAGASVHVWIRDKAVKEAAEYLRSILLKAEHLQHVAVFQRTAASLADLYALAGNFYEAKTFLETQIPHFRDRSALARAHARLAQIFLSSYRSELAWGHVEMALELRDDELLPEIGISVTRIAAEACYQSSRYEEGARFAENCAELAQRSGDFPMFIGATCLRAEGQMWLGRREAARDTALRALESVSNQATALAAPYRTRIYRLLEEMGETQLALSGYLAEIPELRKLDNPFGLAIGLTYLADIFTTFDRLDEARKFHQEALTVRHKIGDKLGEATSLRGLGRTYRRSGRLDEAAAVLARSAQLFQECSAAPGHASVLLELAKVAARQNDGALADRLARQAHRLLVSMTANELRSIGPGSETLVSEANALLMVAAR